MKLILDDHVACVHSAGPDQVGTLGVNCSSGCDAAGHGRQRLIIVDAATIDEGIDSCNLLRAAFPAARLVMMADDYDVATIARCFAAGIDGYLGRAIPCETLIGALQLIVLGEKVVPSQTVMSLIETRPRRNPADWDHSRLGVNLSDREVEILQRLVSGEANKLISRRLMVTEATVKVHVKAILRKLHVLNRTQAAIWAVNQGLAAGPVMHVPLDAPDTRARTGSQLAC